MIGRVRRAAAALERLRYRAWIAPSLAVPHVESVLGLSLWVPPGVLSPRTFGTGALLAESVGERLRPGMRVLDMGAGTGLVGICAAQRGAEVVAVDLDPRAVRATRLNALVNGVELSVLEGDLFSPLAADQRFDLMAFNPPFFARAPRHADEVAFYGGEGLEVLDRFLAGARAHSEPGCRLLIAGSTNGALGRVRELYGQHGFTHRLVASSERISERWVVDQLSA